MTAPERPATPVCASTGCQHPAAAGAQLCPLDIRRLGDWLAQLETEYAKLDAEPSMQGREVGTIGGTTLTSQRSVGRLEVMVLRDPRSKERSQLDPDGNDGRSVLEILYAYAEQVREERDLAQPVTYVVACLFPCMHRACMLGMGHPVRVPLTVTRERKLLATHLDWIISQEWAGEFFDAIQGLWLALRAANGHGAGGRRVRRLPVPCPSCQVRAVTYTPGADHAVCENCGATTALDAGRLSA